MIGSLFAGGQSGGTEQQVSGASRGHHHKQEIGSGTNWVRSTSGSRFSLCHVVYSCKLLHDWRFFAAAAGTLIALGHCTEGLSFRRHARISGHDVQKNGLNAGSNKEKKIS